MSVIATPTAIDDAPEASRAQLQAVEKMLGSVPNMFRLIATSPATLDGYLGLSGALGKGKLGPAMRERIALAVSQQNGCDYCLAAHNYLATNLARLTPEDIAAARQAASDDPRIDAALKFASALVRERGHVSAEEVQAVRDAGYSDGEVLEIIGAVAVDTLTNYVNTALGTEIDFPAVDRLAV